MAKQVIKKLKLIIPAGKATPAPPIGPALGQAAINIGDFVSKFNAATAKLGNDLIPVEISVYADKTYDFVLKTPPTSNLLLKALGAEKGSGKPNTAKIGKVTAAQIREIAEKKLPDLNATSIEAAIQTVRGTARSMGVDVVG
jgi:large subunit ribosomal protein L11